LDRVVTVDGQVLEQRGELYDRVKRAPSGSLFRYRIIRVFQVLELSVPSMTLSFQGGVVSVGV
jgi:hypothetical protein